MSKSLRLAVIVATSMLVAACASKRQEIKQEVEEPHYQPIHISAGKVIQSDAKNARYDDNKTTTNVAKVPVMPELKEDAKPSEVKKPRKSIPIIRENTARKAPSVNYQVANILFANGGASIDASYNSEIAKVAALAKKHDAMVRVYGFASSRTKDTDVVTHKNINFKISLKRAESVARALRRAGVKKENIVIEALSDGYPLYSEAMPEGERLNRRAEVYISY